MMNIPNLSKNGMPTGESEQNYRRIRACVACRNMKIKCVSVPGAKDCESCLRSSRPCHDPGPPKARVKTSQKFSELEKRIDALTSALDAERRRNQESLKQVRTEAPWSNTPDTDRNDTFSPVERQDHDKRIVIGENEISALACDDIIAAGLIDMSTACQLYDHWNLYMRPLMPVVQFSAEDDAYTIRAKKPTLFLTIMTIASTLTRPSLVSSFLTRLNNTLAQEVFIRGAKSIDLLQSLILFSQYYIQPPNTTAFALPQHMYSAVIMSHDLGLTTISNSNLGKDKESYRTSLAVYLGSSCVATLLRRHQPLFFTPSHRACIEALTKGDGGPSDDQWLCSLAVLQEILDDASKTLNNSHNRTNESFDDFGTQHLLGIFRQRLTDWKLSPSGNINPRLKDLSASIVDLYIHQVAIRTYIYQMYAWYTNKEKNNSSQPTPAFSTPHIDALCYCLKAGSSVMNIYLSLDDLTARSLPNTFLVWNLCAAVCLAKIGHFAEELRTNSRDNDGLPSLLDLFEAIVQRLENLSRDGYFPQSRPFIVAFKKLKKWFRQRKIICLNNNGTCGEEGRGPIHGVLGTQTPPASPSSPRAQPIDQSHPGSVLELEPGSNNIITSSKTQYVDQRGLDWNPNLHELGNLKETLGNDTGTTNMTFDTTAEDSNYFNIDFNDLGFGFDDMTDINNFI
ncbi:uncharacterized protein GGS22DRAFT_197925 [Annulohypoxylon maeteangense]|uniref:uncharacterized protein n=1 Tax=Annulohypoxylon maeteangense TaxID=1927788 RepID=UPI002007B670|nr:uncharacterized protein GGS22DRAFT_197925 [Annulohypoxylon maeteangense]KAI0888055.1 hypothetical protein GGS22DRAFT_197925 [Annulohypoxylon maeteangense]